MFNERAIATTDSFVLDDADVRTVLEICRRLDGVPLALKLAAARTVTRPRFDSGIKMTRVTSRLPSLIPYSIL